MPRQARIDATGALHQEGHNAGKQPLRVKTRRVAAYWAVRELGIDGTGVGKNGFKSIGNKQSGAKRRKSNFRFRFSS